MTKDKCCGTCKYHYHENIDDGWVCVNDRSGEREGENNEV